MTRTPPRERRRGRCDSAVEISLLADSTELDLQCKKMMRPLFNILSALALVLCCASVARATDGIIACSGPGAWRIMTDVDVYGSWCAFWVSLMLVPTVYLLARSGHPLLAVAHLPLLILHPSWTVSAWRGDCGSFKHAASTCFVAMAAVAVLESVVVSTQFWRPWPWRVLPRSNRDEECLTCGYDLSRHAGPLSGVRRHQVFAALTG